MEIQKYRKYEKYKDSGIEWLGEIPEHWEIRRLKFIANLQPSNVDKKTVENEIPIYLCNYTDVYYNEYILDTFNFMLATAKDREIKKFRLEQDDIIITKDSEDWSDIGIPAFVPKEIKNVICGYHLTQIKPYFEHVDGEFLFRAIQSEVIANQYRSKANGITRYAISVNTTGQALIPIPPLEEQKQIASFLNKKTKTIDALLLKLHQQVELLKEKRIVLITQAVTKGLDLNVPMKDSGIEWLGEIPEHWIIKKISRIFTIIGSGTTPRSGEKIYYENGIIHWLNSGDLNDNYVTKIKKKITVQAVKDYNLKHYPSGSIVIALYGATVGKLGILTFPSTINQACCVLSKPLRIKSEFIFYYLFFTKDYLLSTTVGGGQPNISQEIIRQLKIPIPPLEEQKQIASFLKEKTGLIDQLLNKINKQVDLIKEYRQALITNSVTGKIDVREEY